MNILTVMLGVVLLVCIFMALSAFKQSKKFKDSHPVTSKELRKEASQFSVCAVICFIFIIGVVSLTK